MELQEWVWIYPVRKNALTGQGCVYAGTFKLIDEAILEPPVRLEKVRINYQETQTNHLPFCIA
jgi:hypothetical protein